MVVARKFNGTPLAPYSRREQDYYRRKGGLPCDGCDKTCGALDYYMVHDHVWCGEAKLSANHCLLCRECLQVRLGRELVIADFTAAPVNIPVLTWYVARERMRRAGVAPSHDWTYVLTLNLFGPFDVQAAKAKSA